MRRLPDPMPHALCPLTRVLAMRIHRLPPELANQIAAGEVVERPASVVKELVENAIDAGAHAHRASPSNSAARSCIVVEDDGEGMTRGGRGARASSGTRPARSASASDLAAIRTLGFRGEALPSIASVSRFRLRTRARGALSGTELRIEAGTHGRRPGGRRAGRHARRGRRSVLQSAGAAEVPEGRHRRVRADLAARHAARARLSARSASC